MTDQAPEPSNAPRTYTIGDLGKHFGKSRTSIRYLLTNYEAVTGEVIPYLPHPNGSARQVNERQFELLRQVVYLQKQKPSLPQLDLIRKLAGITADADEPNPYNPAYLLHVMNQIGEQVMQLSEQLGERENEPVTELAALRAEVAALRQQLADLPKLVRAELRELLMEIP